MKTPHTTHLQRRKGSAMLVIVGLGMTGLLGFVALAIDYGVLTNEANRLQRTVDAAALAGVTQLKTAATDDASETLAKALAKKVAKENGVVDGADGAIFPVPTTGPSQAVQFNVASSSTDRTGSTMIRVTATRNTPLYFARIFGVLDSRLTRTAVAQVQGAIKAPVVPLGITEETYNSYKSDRDLHELTLVRANKESFVKDDVVAFDLRTPTSKSPEHFKLQLTGEEAQISDIGQLETTLNASLERQSTALEDGIAYRFLKAAGEPWRDTWTGNVLTSIGNRYNEIYAGTSPITNPRVINLIITKERAKPEPGTFDTEVTGFAPVYIEKITSTVVDGETVHRLGVRFLPPQTADEDTSASTGSSVTGVRTIRLIDAPSSTNWR